METKNTIKVSSKDSENFNLNLRERLLINFRKKVMQLGFSKIRVDEISEEHGISKKTIYKIFPSKLDMLKAAMHFFMKILEKKVDAIINSNKHFVEKATELLVILGEQTSMATKEGVRDIQKYCPELWEEIEKFRTEKILSKIEKLFKQAKEEKIINANLNERVMISMLIKSVEGIITPDVLMHESFSVKEAYENIFKIFLYGVTTLEGRNQLKIYNS